MTGVLVWKVLREQWLIWLAMAAIALVALGLTVALFEPPGQERGPTGLAVLFGILAYTYGLVVGAMLLAGERESGTAAFLESLPVRRLTVWQAKLLAGCVLVLSQAVFLGVVLLGAGALGDRGFAAGALTAVTVFGFLGFGWGLLFSARTRTTFGAVLLAVLGQAAALSAAVALFLLGLRLLPPHLVEPVAVVALGSLVVLGPFLASWVGQLRLERRQRLEPIARPATGGWRSQVWALAWLELRQGGILFLWLAGLALAAGSLLPLSVLAWPVLTLLLGVVAGVSVFAGEQAEGAGRFLGEQRLPPDVVWAGKVGLRLALALGVALLLLLPALARLQFLVFRRQEGYDRSVTIDFDVLGPFLQLGPYLSLFLLHGFSVGCLCGLLFAKRVVAGFIALGGSVLLAALWAPSLFVGGLHAWQYLGVPVVLLLTVRLLLWPWATGRLGSMAGVLRLVGGLTLAGLWLAWAILYRVVEVPVVTDRMDLAGYVRELEAERGNDAGMKVRNVLAQVAAFMRAEGQRFLRAPPLTEGMGKDTRPVTVDAELKKVIATGWPARDLELAAWLDMAFGQPWAVRLASVPELPLGIVEDIRDQTLGPIKGVGYQTHVVAELLVTRGLQLQARGDPAAFVRNLAIGLAVVRQVRHRQSSVMWFWAGYSEDVLVRGVKLWLEHLGNRPELLRQALALLVDHEKATAREASNPPRTDYLIALNTVNHPEPWLALNLRRRETDSRTLAELVALAWETPWEQARLERLVRLRANDGYHAFPWPQFFDFFGLESSSRHPPSYFGGRLLELRLAELMVALRLYQAETGKPATSLEELTPKIVEAVPLDPVTRKPIGYRLSKGEDVRIAPLAQDPTAPNIQHAPAGQGILTCGNRNYLVPLPAKEVRP